MIFSLWPPFLILLGTVHAYPYRSTAGAVPDGGRHRLAEEPDGGALLGEDQEVVDNLELLESLDKAQQLDLLLDL